MELVLMALTPPNRLAVQVELYTGARIGDILSLKAKQLYTADGKLRDRITIKEQKTGKSRQLRIPRWLMEALARQSGRVYVFEHRLRQYDHRTYAAVEKDIKRASKLLRCDHLNVTTHSARKIYATELDKDISQVQKLLNHSSPAITMIYAMADQVTERKINKIRRRRKAASKD